VDGAGDTASDISRIYFMIRYSSYGSTNNRAPSERTYHLETLAAEYRELGFLILLGNAKPYL